MLKIEDISKTFHPGTVNEKKALDHLTLELMDGDFCTIVGSNGAGKSTMFNAIAGSFYCDEGYIELDGEDITYVPEHKRSRYIGRLFQDPLMGTAPGMTIEENLAVAYLRSSRFRQGIFSRVSRREKAMFREHLSLLG
ncbi:MAG: ATP-binding cassette domain-containing protein, partial [Lachnospiraceae bacterium]|nr:ATP-binding cassette domain-containing protein [Lachnospiraceae bacterium]